MKTILTSRIVTSIIPGSLLSVLMLGQVAGDGNTVGGCASAKKRGGGFGGSQQAERLEVGAAFPNSVGSGANSTESLYGYKDTEDPAHFYNVFKMPDGKIISLTVTAKSERGNYAGDELLMCDLTDMRSQQVPIGPLYRSWIPDESGRMLFSYTVDFSNSGQDLRIMLWNNLGDVNHQRHGPSVILSMNKLYQLRAAGASMQRSVGSDTYYLRGQGGERGYELFFTDAVHNAASTPDSTRHQLAPSYVVPASKVLPGGITEAIDESPIGDSGYIFKTRTGEILRAE